MSEYLNSQEIIFLIVKLQLKIEWQDNDAIVNCQPGIEVPNVGLRRIRSRYRKLCHTPDFVRLSKRQHDRRKQPVADQYPGYKHRTTTVRQICC